ncbi:MAG: thiamine ABC transporter substrate-binding protein [Marmoricola sp.]|nr:thiamine ABC transporter substrate-binding protein [Marmoricola sp.]
MVFVRGVLALLLLPGLVLGLSACGSDSGGGSHPTTLVLATHDSWAMSKKVMADFTKQTGITVTVQPQGDAGELTNRLVLTKDAPTADGFFGIDNTFESRAVDGGIVAGGTLTPIDYGDVCVNVDDTWFARHKLAPPRTLDDLTKAAYKDLFVTPGATTSSPGLAFLLATIAAKGAGWQEYWKALMANGTKVDAGWSDAWQVDYTSGGGHGTRPIVLSYSSSPPDTVPKGGTKPTTSALLDTCFRQVEYAGVLTGSHNAAGMRKLIAFMRGREFQSALPGQMYVYPATKGVALPADWATYAPVSPKPYYVSPSQITEHRSTWLRQWRDLISR